MEIEWGFLCKALHDGDFSRAREVGIDYTYFPDPKYSVVWKFIDEYYTEYRTTPSIENIQTRFGVEVKDTKETLEYWIDELQNKKIEEGINETAIKVSGFMEKGKPRQALDELTEFTKAANRNFAKTNQKSILIKDMKEVVWQHYLDAKAGKMGFKTPWPTMNERTMGWWEKDISTFIARAGSGKTFLLLLLALEAVKKDPVLFISCEMSKEDISQRYFSILFRKNYGGLRKGKLSTYDETGLRLCLNDYNPEINLEIRDGSQGLHISDIERVIETTKSKFIIVDSCYRIKSRQKAKDRYDNMAYTFEELKLLSQVYNKAIIVSTQQNRDYAKKKGSQTDMTDIALSDVVSWTSTNIFSLRKNADDVGNLLITPLKIREAENTNCSLKIKWDLSIMDFSEVGLFSENGREDDRKDKGYSNKGRPYADDRDLDEAPY